MMIKCPKCGFENQLGAIFCRNCGDKLNIEEVRPKVVDKGGGFNIFSILYRLFILIILFGLIGTIIAMFIPADQSSYPSLSDDTEQKNARVKIKKLIERVDEGIGDTKYTFSPREATFAFNDTFLAKVEGDTGGAYAVEKVAFKIDQRGFVNILLLTKLGGKISTTFEIKGAIVNPSEESKDAKVSFKIAECKMGNMPIKFLEKQVIDKFKPTIETDRINKIINNIKSIEINDDKEFVITLR